MQKKHYLPRILSSEDWWCQAIPSRDRFDLASLKTAAERQGDHYIVNGQKMNTHGQWADMCFCWCHLERREETGGISFLLIDITHRA